MDQILILLSCLCGLINQLVPEHRTDAHGAQPTWEHALLVWGEHQHARAANHPCLKPQANHHPTPNSGRPNHLRRPLPGHHWRPQVQPRWRHQQLQMAVAAPLLLSLWSSHPRGQLVCPDPPGQCKHELRQRVHGRHHSAGHNASDWQVLANHYRGAAYTFGSSSRRACRNG